MRVIGYVRVSTATQVDKGAGLEEQEQEVRAWARSHGHQVVRIAREEGVSGSNGLEDRVALPEVIGALKAGDAGGVVVYRLDRLARDLIVQETLLAEMRRMGREVFTTSAAEQGYLEDDPHDPSRRLIRQVLGAVAEYERAMIALRLAAGRRYKRERGGYAGGRAPFGYRAEGGELVPDETERRVIAAARRLHRQGHSLRRIAVDLEARGYRPRMGGRWHPNTVRQVLGLTR